MIVPGSPGAVAFNSVVVFDLKHAAFPSQMKVETGELAA